VAARPFILKGVMEENNKEFPLELTAGDNGEGMRLDKYIVECVGGFSRSWWQRQIRSGAVLVNGEKVKTGYPLESGDKIYVNPTHIETPSARPVDMPLDIIYEDEDVVVVSKPPGLSVHPPGPSSMATLAGALVARYKKLATVGGLLRPGIVHRLDRDTTGVIIVARNDSAHAFLGAQFAARTTEKTYIATVLGEVAYDEDVIDAPIARHSRHRQMMTIAEGGRQAQTRYKVLERFDGFTLVELKPKTGRTHQIRLHMKSIGHPVAGDDLYGRGPIKAHEIVGHGDEIVLGRMALHALRLEIDLPGDRGRHTFEAPIPQDIAGFVELLRLHKKKQ